MLENRRLSHSSLFMEPFQDKKDTRWIKWPLLSKLSCQCFQLCIKCHFPREKTTSMHSGRKRQKQSHFQLGVIEAVNFIEVIYDHHAIQVFLRENCYFPPKNETFWCIFQPWWKHSQFNCLLSSEFLSLSRKFNFFNFPFCYLVEFFLPFLTK